MSKDEERLLKELYELLLIEKKDLRTAEEKNAEIDRIIEIWCNLSENAQTEELLLQVLNRTKMSWIIYGQREYFQKNIDNVRKIFDGTKEILKSENSYLKFIEHLKEEFYIDDIKEFLNDEKRPFLFQEEKDYSKLALIFYNDYYRLTAFIEKYVPSQYRSAEFYKKIFEKQSEIGISYGRTSIENFWELVPDNVKSKELFLEICRRADSHGLKKLFNIVDKSYFDKQFVSELPNVIARLYMIIPDVINEALSKLPQNLLTQEFYSNMMNEFFEYAKNHDSQTIFKETIPDKFKTEDMALSFVKKFSNYFITEIFKYLPDNIRTEQFYTDFFTAYGTNKESAGNAVYVSVSTTLKQIPKEYFTEQNMLNMLFQKQEDPEASGQLYEIIVKFVKDELKELYPKGLSKEFYEKLIENNPEDELFTIFNSMPSEYKTEDMYIRTLEKNLKNPGLEQSFIFTLDRTLEANPALSKNFSKKFYKKIFLSSNKIHHVGNIYNNMPKEFQTEEMCLEIVSKFKSNENVGGLVNYLLPKKLTADEVYVKIIDIVKTIEDENGQIIGNNAEALKSLIQGLPTELKGKEYVVNLLSSFNDENGNVIYTPANLVYLKHSWGNKKFIEKRLLEILNNEITNVEQGIINEKQFKQYENELNELLGLNLGVASKTELYGLNAIYLMISEESIPEETKKKFYDIISNVIPNLKNENNEKVIGILAKMFDSNNELFVTLDKRFIESDKYLELFGTEKFEILALYPDIQKQILTLNEKQLSLVANMIDFIIKNQSQQQGQIEDWIPITDKILRSFNNDDFNKIFENIQITDFEKLDEDTIQNLYTVISKKKNYFNINTLEDLQNYKYIKQKICEGILDNSQNVENLPQDIQVLTQTDRKRFAILQLKYNIDLVEAKTLIEKYGYDFSKEMLEDEIFLGLRDIKEIIENEDFMEYKSFNEKSINFSNIESILREKIKRTYQDKLYSVESHEQDETNDFDSTYDGKKVKVYQAKDDFNMIIHALGAYSGNRKIQNYSDDWNIAKMRYHGLCTSYIGNNSIATARVKDVVYGFDDIESTHLLLSAPWDIGSNSANQKFATANMKAHIKFLNPQMQINCTRHTHNEMVFDRRNFKKGDMSQKMQPSYIVYIPEYLNGKTSKEIDAILSNNTSNTVMQEFMKQDELWEKTKKAASQFDVPIVIIDRLHYARQEKEKIEECLKTFEETLDPKLLNTIITEFENNRTGYREYHEAICNKFFSDKIMNTYLKRIIQAIEKEKGNPRLQLSNYEELTLLISRELENRNSFRKTQDDKIEKYWNEELKNIESQKNRVARKCQGLEEKDSGHELENIINMFKSKNEFKEELKFIKRETYEQIQDMKERNLYDGKLIHSDRHIQDVMLFSGILGEQFGLTARQKMLLAEAAKFHDAGRINDGDRNHAVASANIAGEKLKRMYSAEDLKIIQIAIEYHEALEKDKGKLDNIKLQELFDKYELDKEKYDETAKIAEILKDADALDRTRFAEGGRLKEVYLHSDKSKGLVKFATALNEEYAKQDIEDMLEVNNSIKESVMSYKERTGKSWLSVLRDIRTRKFIPKSNQKITGKEIAEASISSLYEIEMSDRENQALCKLIQQDKEGVKTNEQS